MEIKRSFVNTVNGLAMAGGLLVPSQSSADNLGPKKAIHDVSDQHSAHNYAVVGLEANPHMVLGHVLYTRELLHHFSAGVGLGLGSGHEGKFSGVAEGVLAAHKTVVKPFYLAGELGLGAEWIGRDFTPIAKITGLVGVQINNTLGFAVGPTVVTTPEGTVTPSGTANLAIGF